MTTKYPKVVNGGPQNNISTYTSAHGSQYYTGRYKTNQDTTQKKSSKIVPICKDLTRHNTVERSNNMPEDTLLSVYKDLSDKIDDKYDKLDNKLDTNFSSLNNKLDTIIQEIGKTNTNVGKTETKLGEKEKDIVDLKKNTTDLPALKEKVDELIAKSSWWKQFLLAPTITVVIGGILLAIAKCYFHLI